MTNLQKTDELIEMQRLTKKATEYASQSVSDATKRAYQSDLALFVSWCQTHKQTALPADPGTVALYLTHLAEQGRATSTIARAMSSISQAHKISGLRTPTNAPEVSVVWKGIKRTHGTSPRQARPLLLNDLKTVVSAIRPSFLGRRDKAILLLGWCAAMRRSEIVALDVGDLEFCTDGLIVTIRRSKTDQEGQSYRLGIPFARSENERWCPVKAVREWLDISGLWDKSGAVFFFVGTAGKRWHTEIEHRRRLRPKAVNTILARRLKQAKLSTRGYSGHSLRAGFITSAAKAETPENLIQIHSRHKSIKIMRGYIRDGSLFSSNPLSVLL